MDIITYKHDGNCLRVITNFVETTETKSTTDEMIGVFTFLPLNK
jgi:hypothetical protein